MIGDTLCDGINRSNGVIRLADKASKSLRSMILENGFGTDEPLSEIRLAKLLGVSRTPVREAINQLEQEGLLKIIPGKGAFVAEMNGDDFREINDLRMMLEPFAAVMAIRVIPNSVIAHHKKIWQDLRVLTGQSEELPIKALVDADNNLHSLFIDHCTNRRMRNFLNVLRYQFMRYLFTTWNIPVFAEDTIDQHLEIIKAMEERDADTLRASLENHLMLNNRIYQAP